MFRKEPPLHETKQVLHEKLCFEENYQDNHEKLI